MRVHFTKLELESGADTLQLFDGSGHVVQQFDNSSVLTDVWSNWATGRWVSLSLQTNGTVNNYGFQMDKYEAGFANTPRSGVTVALSPGGLTATSDSSGNYVIHCVPKGDYTITPTAAGATFDPGSRAVTLNGDELVSGMDFVWQ